MRAVIQRVSRASAIVSGEVKGSIGAGLLVLVGVTMNDARATAQWLAGKIVGLRIFPDSEGKMNLSAQDIGAEILIVSNFTLYGNAQKGFRPSFAAAAPSDFAEPIYDYFLEYLRNFYPALKVESGVFGAAMEIELVNDGPVTILIEK